MGMRMLAFGPLLRLLVVTCIVFGASATVASAAPPTLRLSSTHYNFGRVAGGGTATTDLAVTNAAGWSVAIVNVSIDYSCGSCGDFPPLFSVTSTCPGAPLVSGASCTVSIAFNPPAGVDPNRYTAVLCAEYPDPRDATNLVDSCWTLQGRGT